MQNCNECIANTKSTKEIALADAKDVKVAFITSHFAGAVFVLTRPTEEDEETVTVSLAYVIVVSYLNMLPFVHLYTAHMD